MDFTTPMKSITQDELIRQLKETCREWVVQGEKGEKGGYEHWQGRVILKEKKRISGKHQVTGMFAGCWSPTVTSNKGNYDYVTKENTRICGPFKHDDQVMTRQLTEFIKMDLRPYQKDILNWINEPNDRVIDIVHDQVGNVGKSIFSEFLEFMGHAEEVPPMRDMKDIMGWVCTRPTRKMYVFDMPRGMKKDKLAEFYSGIECIKNGIAYDPRYTAKKVRFSRPRVVVFTNCLPEFSLLSMDRWKVWEMKHDYSIEHNEKVSQLKEAQDSLKA